MARPKLLIPHYFSHAKYYPGVATLPYHATGAKLKDEIEKRSRDVEVILATDAATTEAGVAVADFVVAYWVQAELLEKARRLRWIQFAGAGRRGIKALESLAPESELWDLDNVIIAPNTGSGTPRIYEQLAAIVVDNCRRIAAGEEPTGRHA